MKKYNIMKVNSSTGYSEVLETVKANNMKEARQYATKNYLDIVLSGTHNVVVKANK